MLIAVDLAGVLSVIALSSREEYKRENMTDEDYTCVYYFLDFMETLQETFHSNKFIICCEGGSDCRKKVYPTYKQNRKDRDPDTMAKLESMFEQERVLLDILRDANIMIAHEWGYEGDDMIGSICINNPDKKIMIVSQDKDMHQLITDKVSVVNFRKNIIYNNRNFKDYHDGLSPKQFLEALCMCGDKADNVMGIESIGLKTAAKYLKNDLKPHLKAYKRITDNLDVVAQNKQVIQLPFEDTPAIVWEDREYNTLAFLNALEKYNMTDISRGSNQLRWSKLLRKM